MNDEMRRLEVLKNYRILLYNLIYPVELPTIMEEVGSWNISLHPSMIDKPLSIQLPLKKVYIKEFKGDINQVMMDIHRRFAGIMTGLFNKYIKDFYKYSKVIIETFNLNDKEEDLIKTLRLNIERLFVCNPILTSKNNIEVLIYL